MNGNLSILIRHVFNREIIILSIYIDDFFFASNRLITFEVLKKELSQKYSIKDIGEILTIIGWQITQDSVSQSLKIDP